MKNTQTISTNTALFERAKKDYKTGLYTWYDLKQKHGLNIKQVFKIIFEVREENNK